jgi:hypothetical protein
VFDYQIDASRLVTELERYGDGIASVDVFQDARLEFVADGDIGQFADVVGEEIPVSRLW